jgi:hypothetical protein
MSGAIVTNTFRQSNADNFKNSIEENVNDEYVNNYYLVIGRPEPWDDDKNPTDPTDSPVSDAKISRDLIAGKRITAGDVKHVVPRVNWKSGEIYQPYEHDKLNIAKFIDDSGNATDNPFYVLTSQNHVWVCIANNGNNLSGSTQEPVLSSPSQNYTDGNGYDWRYLYSLTTSDIQNFLSLDFMPVNDIDVTVYTSHIEGGVETIQITSGGSGYTPTTDTTLCDIIGDGEGAKATIIVDSNESITSATIATGNTGTPGKPYTFASVDLSLLTHNGTGDVAELKPIISPTFGHGGNNPKELGAVFIMIKTNLEGDEDGAFIVDRDFRQLGILKNPTKDNSMAGLSLTISCLKSMTFTAASGTVFLEDEVIEQTQSNGVARGIVVDDKVVVDGSTNTHTLRYIQQDETGLGFESGIIIPFVTYDGINNNPIITVRSSGGNVNSNNVVTLVDPDIDPNTGDLLYIENRRPISRSTDQTENIKLIVEF